MMKMFIWVGVNPINKKLKKALQQEGTVIVAPKVTELLEKATPCGFNETMKQVNKCIRCVEEKYADYNMETSIVWPTGPDWLHALIARFSNYTIMYPSYGMSNTVDVSYYANGASVVKEYKPSFNGWVKIEPFK